ncbi:MAG: GAF domain-containing protein, partial [Chloroflexota bacterium]
MKTQLADFNLPISVWESLHNIDNLLGQSLEWSVRLETINNILVDALEVDTIWLLTIHPLPPTASGLMLTPLTINPQAKVQVTDKGLPVARDWPQPDTILGHVLGSKQPCFIQPDEKSGTKTDSDLGDVFFGAFNAIPAAVIPLVAEGNSVGALIVGSQDLVKTSFAEEIKSLLVYLGEHLGVNLNNSYLLDQSRRHSNAVETLNLIANTITSSLDIDEVIQRTMAGINEMLTVEAGSLLLLDEESGEIYFKITLRGENKQITSFRLKSGEGIAGWVIDHNQPVIVNDPSRDRRFTTKIDNAIGFETSMVLCV